MNDKIRQPVFEIHEDVCLHDETQPDGFRKVVIEGCEWYGPEADNWEHIPSYYYNIAGEEVVWPEESIRKCSSMATAAYILDNQMIIYGHKLIWEIAGAIEGQIRLVKESVTDKYSKYFR